MSFKFLRKASNSTTNCMKHCGKQVYSNVLDNVWALLPIARVLLKLKVFHILNMKGLTKTV